MKNLLNIIWITVALIACKKDQTSKPQKFANAIVGHWIGDSTVYKSTYGDGHVEGGPAIHDSSFFQFNSNGTFEKYESWYSIIEDNTGNNGGTYELRDSLIILKMVASWGGREYKIINISDKSLVLYRVAFGNPPFNPLTNEQWYYYRK